VAAPEELTRDELIELARRQDVQIITMAGRMAELLEANEGLSVKLAQLEHLLSRNSRNSSSPPSK
jgi:transposase